MRLDPLQWLLLSTLLPFAACRSEPPAALMPVARPQPPRAADPLIKRETLFGDPDRSGVRLSPDGNYLSWRAPLHGVVNLWVAPVADLDAARAVTNATKRPLSSYFWAHNNKHLLYVRDRGGDENFHLYRVDISTGETKDLTPIDGVRVAVYAASPRRANEIVVGLNDRDPRFHDLYALDLSSGDRKLLLKNSGLVGFELDAEHNVVAATRPDKRGGKQFLVRSQAASTWKALASVALEDSQTTSTIAVDESGSYLYMWDSA